MSDFISLNQEFKYQACEILKEEAETEFLVQGRMSASFCTVKLNSRLLQLL